MGHWAPNSSRLVIQVGRLTYPRPLALIFHLVLERPLLPTWFLSESTELGPCHTIRPAWDQAPHGASNLVQVKLHLSQGTISFLKVLWVYTVA